MANKEEKLNPRDFYLIDTKTRSAKSGRDYTYQDYDKNPEVLAMKAKVATGKLKDEYPEMPNASNLCAQAKNFIKPEHTTPEVDVYSTDENGHIWIPKHDLKTAQVILKALKSIDPGVKVDPMGLDIPPMKEVPVEAKKSSLRDKILS